MLQVCLRQSSITRLPKLKGSDPLRQRTLNSGSLGIALAKFFCRLTLASRLESKMLLAWA